MEEVNEYYALAHEYATKVCGRSSFRFWFSVIFGGLINLILLPITICTRIEDKRFLYKVYDNETIYEKELDEEDKYRIIACYEANRWDMKIFEFLCGIDAYDYTLYLLVN